MVQLNCQLNLKYSSWEYSNGGPNITINNVTFAQMASSMACWEHSCDYSMSGVATLYVSINNTQFACPPEGGIISVAPFFSDGFVNCPKTSLLCDRINGNATIFPFLIQRRIWCE
jgi:hypothetical protein